MVCTLTKQSRVIDFMLVGRVRVQLKKEVGTLLNPANTSSLCSKEELQKALAMLEDLQKSVDHHQLEDE